MYLHSFRIKNFRRLADVHINLEDDISIFVGSNNSGKTSATQALDLFVNAAKDKLSIYDFSSFNWAIINEIGNGRTPEGLSEFPSIAIDLWFTVDELDLHRVVDLLPSLEWHGTEVGLRISFQPKHLSELMTHYNEARQKVVAFAGEEGTTYLPWPKNLVDFLTKELSHEYEFAYYALDRAQFDDKFKSSDEYIPRRLGNERGRSVVKSLLKVDCLNAQRHLSDVNASARSEDLSKCLSRFYKRNLEKRDDDHTALQALSSSELQLNDHLARVFEPTLSKLNELGYPGFTNPHLVIKSALNPATLMSQDARVHYSLNGASADLTLPDSHNGLGFKNLIFMVVEILDLQARWIEEEDEERALLHIIFIEEPEAHLHAQLQQVFIRRILSLLEIDGEDSNSFKSQIVVTTHSPHILYENGFKPIRYFRRKGIVGVDQASDCVDMSYFYDHANHKNRDFLERYLRLTHCDLFFADAAILVEGNVERLLLPIMIKKSAEKLQSSCLSILEVGGAFAHRFKPLIEFLGIVCLIITDLDSVSAGAVIADDNVSTRTDVDAQSPEVDLNAPMAADGHGVLVNVAEEGDVRDSNAPEPDDDEDEVNGGHVCMANEPNAVTSNQCLRSWLPGKTTITDLLSATVAEKTQDPTALSEARIRVAYQSTQSITYKGASAETAGRTLEETFGLENADWCQLKENHAVGLRFRPQPEDISSLAAKLHKRIKGSGFDKTNFALNVLMKDESTWVVPRYIAEGLKWLEDQVSVEVNEELAEAVNDAISGEVKS